MSPTSEKNGIQEISLSSNLMEVMKKFPGTKTIIRQLDLNCITCKGARQETVREAARVHGLDPSDLLNELRKAAG